MLIQYYKGYLGMEKIRELINITKNGTTAFHIIEGAKKIGFNANGYNCELNKFEEENIMLPCIANVIINKSYSHFIVIYNINYKKKELLIADPSNKIMKISFDNFEIIFSGTILILYPNRKLPYTRQTKFSFKNLSYLLKDTKHFIINTIILSFFIIIYSILSSFYAQFMLSNIQNEEIINKYVFLFIIFSAVTVLKTLSEFFRDKIFIYLTTKIELIMNMDISNKILSLPYRYYRNHTTGDIITRIRESSIIKESLCKWLLVLIIDIPLMIISIIFIYLINSTLALLSIISFLLFMILLKFFQNPIEDSIEECQEANSELTSIEIESISAFETIKGIDIELFAKRKIEKSLVNFLDKIYNYQRIVIIKNNINEFILNICYFFIFLIGCLYVKDEKISFGALLTFQSLFNYFIGPLKQMLDLDSDTKKAKKAFERLMDLYIEEKDTGFFEKNINGNITFNNLTYSYDYNKPILRNINLEIEEGEKVIVIGKSGSGKSSLFKLLKGYYPVNRELIKIDGKDINDIKNKNNILYINQSEILFTDTIYNNIIFDSKIAESELFEIIKICELDSIIKNSNLGYSLLIEENGFNLSGGERQKIILARTLIKRFNILIIDEGLNQLDIDAERRILTRVFSKYKNKTIIVISHRLENLDLFNKMVKMKSGSIIESNSKNRKYRSI